MLSETNALSDTELAGVTGGLKWEKGTKNDDVVDARGGQVSIFGYSVTFDVSGNVSSVTPPK
jgi:hypothetical protein